MIDKLKTLLKNVKKLKITYNMLMAAFLIAVLSAAVGVAIGVYSVDNEIFTFPVDVDQGIVVRVTEIQVSTLYTVSVSGNYSDVQVSLVGEPIFLVGDTIHYDNLNRISGLYEYAELVKAGVLLE